MLNCSILPLGELAKSCEDDGMTNLMLNCALSLCSNNADPLANFVKLGQIEKDKVASSRSAQQADIDRDLVNYPTLLLQNLGGGGGRYR